MRLLNIPFVRLVLIATLLNGLSSVALASPYATSLTNNAGAISFILNESADSVKIISNNGATTNNLGALPKGTASTNLGVSGVFKVVVTKSAPAIYTQTSVDTNSLVTFNSPRGVTVNQNPASPYFGRIYVANSADGSTTGPGGRPVGDGIYLLNADQTDAVGRGTNASTAGIDFSSSANDPYKISVGPDDKLYINNFSIPAATTWVVDANVTSNSLVLAGIGENTNPTVHSDSASTPIAQGSLTSSNLTLYNIEGTRAGNDNSIARWDIGAGPLPYNNPPVILGNAGLPANPDLPSDLDIGPDGKFYTMINRPSGTDTDSVRVFDNTGTNLLWGSLTNGVSPDPLRAARALMVSPGGRLLGLIHDNSSISVLKLTNGIPDLASRIIITNPPVTSFLNPGRDLSFDAAGNIYAVSSGQQLLRVFSAGGTTVATTGSDGTFTINSQSSGPIMITSIRVIGGSVQIEFTGSPDDLASAFKLQSATTVVGPYLDDTSASIIAMPIGSGSFRATTLVNGSTRFYRIARQ
ncbi:MAG: hypothetical protein M3Y82_07380 [Verrucomicrobiota bacterium]|nr:hypothetical protein [Verrucomicrobiota bacterium]